MTRNMELPTNTLLHTFGVYNAIVESSDGTLVHWNNTLGFFERNEEDDSIPFANIEGMSNVRSAVDAFVKSEYFLRQ